MGKTFEERVEEVLGELHGMAWPLLEESEKRKITGKVIQGVDRHGDKQVAWARALGVPTSTLSDRIANHRSSKPIDGVRAGRENAKKRVRHIRSGLKDPEIREQVKEDASASTEVRKLAKEIEAEEAWDPIEREVAKSDSETRNIAAMADIAKGRELIGKGVAGADFPAMSQHNKVGVEVLFRATEADMAVGRAAIGGEVSDDAIKEFIGEGV